MSGHLKLILISAVIVLAIILLIVYLYIYNRILNKPRANQIYRLMDPYKVIRLVIIGVILGSTVVMVIPCDNKNDELPGESGPIVEGSDYLTTEINVFINISNIDEEQKMSLDEKINQSKIPININYESVLKDANNYDIIVTSESISSNIKFDDYLAKKESLIDLMEILESEFTQ